MLGYKSQFDAQSMIQVWSILAPVAHAHRTRRRPQFWSGCERIACREQEALDESNDRVDQVLPKAMPISHMIRSAVASTSLTPCEQHKAGHCRASPHYGVHYRFCVLPRGSQGTPDKAESFLAYTLCSIPGSSSRVMLLWMMVQRHGFCNPNYHGDITSSNQ